MYVFDATPLIYLAKVGMVSRVATARDCCIPDQVYEEVVEVGLRDGHADARRIQVAIEEGVLRRTTVSDEATFARLQENQQLSDADAAVLTIATETDGIAVMDERYGRAIADAEGIRTRGTAYLVLTAAREGTLTSEEARTTIDAMVEAGWYVSPALYAKLLRKIEDLS